MALPTRWLMTDERLGDDLWSAIDRLPRGAGIVFRHHSTPPAARRALFGRVARIAAARELLLLQGGAAGLGPRGDGFHGRHGPGLRSLSVHSLAQALIARRARVDLVFVSPVFATRSHPGAKALGPWRAAVLARIAGVPAIALGGMDERRFARLRRLGFHGWAGIDAWAAAHAGQKRKAVPI